MSTNIVWITVIIYSLVALLIAFVSRTKKTGGMSDYFLGGRKLGGFLSMLSYSATTYSAFMLMGLAGFTYKGGVGALGFELIYLTGVVLVAFFGPRFWIAGKKHGYVTPSEMLGDRYESKAVAVVTALASCIFLIPYAAAQLTGISLLLQGVTGGAIPFEIGLMLAVILAVLFTMLAGMRSVAWTDALQALVMIVTATAVVLLVIASFGGFGEMFHRVSTEHPGWLSVKPNEGFFSFSFFLGLSLPWFFFSLSNPQVSQRLFMPKSLKSLRRMLLGFLVFGFIYTFVSIFWGYAALLKFPGLENPDLATPQLLASDIVPPVLGMIVMVGIMAAAISTVDSIILTLSSLIARDVYAGSDEKRQLLVGKLVIPVIAVLALIFAWQQFDLIAVLSVSASAGLLVIVPSLIGTFFWSRGTKEGALASVIVGGLLVILFELKDITLLGQGTAVWALIVSVLLFVGISLMTKPPAKAETFLTELKDELAKKGAV